MQRLNTESPSTSEAAEPVVSEEAEPAGAAGATLLSADGILTQPIPDRTPIKAGEYTYAICRAIAKFGPDDWLLRLGRL
ncbi:MAG: hypothetical protein AAF749_10355, partial [Pseudomonadota bacterium]